MNRLLDKYQFEVKKYHRNQTLLEFRGTLNNIFYIGTCKCDLTAAQCTCGLVPECLKEFMHDQHNQRNLTIDTFLMEIEEEGATSSMPTFEDPDDSTYVTMTVEEDIVNRSTSSQYTERYGCFNFALMSDRFGAPDRDERSAWQASHHG